MSNRDDAFTIKLQQYDSLLWYVSKHYEIEGVLPREDLYQEALIVLDETVEVDEEHIRSDEFARELRNNLKYRLANARRHLSRDKRDWRRLLALTDGSAWGGTAEEPTPAGVTSTMSHSPSKGCPEFIATIDLEEQPNPETIVIETEESLKAQAFIGDLIERVDPTSQQVLNSLLADDLPDEVASRYRRLPKHTSQEMLAQMLGWDRSKVKRALERIRKAARRLQLEQNGYDGNGR
jgi:RNA polymerase sigma factor (sigma-70 family)